MPKYIILVLDGAADRIEDSPTSLERAHTPGLDTLAKVAVGGVFYPIDKETAPESDAAVLALLGYDPYKYYTGRGPIEALGAGIRIKEGWEVAFRANFATVDPKTRRIVDRRVGRSLTTEESRELAKALDGMRLSKYGGYVRFVATVGHRAVVIIGSTEYKLSDAVSNIDPAYERKGRVSVAVKNYEPYIAYCRPLDDSLESKITCELVNEFVEKAIEVLDSHPLNIEREKKGLPKANAVLLRDAGVRLPRVDPISKIYNKEFGAVVEMPVERGVAIITGMEIAEVPPPTPDKAYDYDLRLKATLDLLKRVDVVYVHLKGPDEPGHDGDIEGKIKAIELIDRYFVQPLIDAIDLNNVAVIVTADHPTPPKVKAHTSGPVPIIVAYANLPRRDSLTKFSEKECLEKGSLGVIEHGYEVLRTVFSLVEGS